MSDTDDEPEDDDVQLVGLPVADERHGLRSRLPIEILATQFADECREASRAPTIEDYARRYPKLAGEIREFFPMILAMERWKGEREDAYLRKQVPDEFSVEKLGEYRIVREIGRGGMGVVFEASQDNVSRRVAVKLLPWRIEHAPRWHRRFTQEARMLGQLRHPNIVPIYQFGEQDGYCYYVMQYIDGQPLNEVISGNLSPLIPLTPHLVTIHKIGVLIV